MVRAAAGIPVRAAVIGTGRISEEHLRFLNDDRRVHLAAVCDVSPSLANYAASRFHAAAAYTDPERMLKEVHPDVVHVLTPPHTHVWLVDECVDAGAHVIVEKPVTPTHAEFCDLWCRAAARGRRIIEDHNYRFNKPVRQIEQLVRDGELGEIREVDVRLALNLRAAGGRYADANLPHPSHRLPGGIIHEFITHLSYLALRFLPSFERVTAAWSNHGDSGPFRYDDLDALVIGGSVHARLRFTCQTAPESFCLTVRGTRGWAETDLFHPYLRIVRSRPLLGPAGPLANRMENGIRLFGSGLRGFRDKLMRETPYEGLRTFLARTYDSFHAGTEPPVGYADMDGASRLVEALLCKENRR